MNAVFSCGGSKLWLWLLLQYVPFVVQNCACVCVYCVQHKEYGEK